MNNRILLVEDERKLAASIQNGLCEAGFEAAVASTGQEGKDMFYAADYDCAVIDINLPQINGYDLVRLIRSKNSSVPIIIITALSQTDHKLKGFDLGADNYLVKPFEFKELLARIRVGLRRASQIRGEAEERLLEIADLRMNLDSKEVERAGRAIQLTAKEFLLLEFLLKNRNRVVSREEIALNVWEIDFDPQTNVIDVYINYLRRKIDKEFSSRLIHTVTGMGYILKSKED